MTIATIVIQDDAQFDAAISRRRRSTAKVKVVIRPEQAKVPQTQRLSMRPVANIAVADVDVNLPDMDQSLRECRIRWSWRGSITRRHARKHQHGDLGY